MNPKSVHSYINRLPRLVFNLCQSLEEKSPSTAGHCKRVGLAALELAAFSCRFDDDELCLIFQAGYLHDLGKLVVPLSVLDKPSGLSEEDWGVIRASVVCGESLLRPFLPPGAGVLDAVRHGRERWDGGGYPEGFRGNQIPVASRIVHIADTMDALRIRTAYRCASGLEESLKVLNSGSGSQFDPDWVRFAHQLWKPSEATSHDGCALISPPIAVPVAHNNRELAF
jgi:HD-GYP domain-containing protein (c-di-GMP phosphodiesterase class II)